MEDIDFKDEILENPDESVCSLEFYYDDRSNDAMIRLSHKNPREMEPLALYALACMEIVDKYNEEIIELMKEYMIPSGHCKRVH